ncbi:MAG: PP2C family protein-serine/threonine phosphatase [Calditrichaeota bacterium]|nr:PP2C family protein-serine/threonine phosphatase [Calditrichota bacterium]
MIRNPKEYYRKLDAILAEIDQLGSDKILPMILKELVNTLGKDLHIRNGRLYELALDEFVPVQSDNLQAEARKPLPLKSSAIQEVLRHGCYIFHEDDFLLDVEREPYEFVPQVAFTVQKNEIVWLFVLELYDGWEREAIEFSINTIRKVLNARLISEWMKSSLYQAEMIQRSLLPRKPPEIPGFDIYGKSISAEIVGGDLYDYMLFDEGNFGVAVGDASGHGLPAALLVRDVVTGLRMGLEKEMKISPVLEKLNRVIHRSTLSTAFISLFYAEIENNGDVVYINAGHPEAMLAHRKKVDLLKRGGTILGPLPKVKLQRGFTNIPPGGVLVLYSDGIIERRNHFGEAFEKEKLKHFIVDNLDLSAERLAKEILNEVFNFGNHTPWDDDVTVVVIKRLPKTSQTK